LFFPSQAVSGRANAPQNFRLTIIHLSYKFYGAGKMSKPTKNPYLDARREWDERYGDSIARARTWRIVAIGAIGVAALAVAGVAWIGSQSKIKPFVVAMDTIGNPIAMAQPSGGLAVSQRIVEATVANFIWNARTQLADQAAQKVLLDRVYAVLSSDSSAYLNDYFKLHSPFSGDGMTTSVEISSILPVSKDSFQVNWKESKFNTSQPMGSALWKANVTVGIDAKLAEKPEVMINNPLGIYIKSISWTQVLSN